MMREMRFGKAICAVFAGFQAKTALYYAYRPIVRAGASGGC